MKFRVPPQCDLTATSKEEIRMNQINAGKASINVSRIHPGQSPTAGSNGSLKNASSSIFC